MLPPLNRCHFLLITMIFSSLPFDIQHCIWKTLLMQGKKKGIKNRGRSLNSEWEGIEGLNSFPHLFCPLISLRSLSELHGWVAIWTQVSMHQHLVHWFQLHAGDTQSLLKMRKHRISGSRTTFHKLGWLEENTESHTQDSSSKQGAYLLLFQTLFQITDFFLILPRTVLRAPEIFEQSNVLSLMG